MTKPVIYKGKGWPLWYCEAAGTHMGWGITPARAYACWERVNVGD